MVLSQIAKYPIFVRVPLFVVILLLLWVPVAVPIYYWGTDPNWISILTMAGLYLEFIILVKLWGKRVYQQPQILQDYGLVLSRSNFQDWLQGLILGTLSLLTLFAIEGSLGWITWLPAPPTIIQVILEGFLVAVGVSFAEELLFRGWLLDELQRDYSPSITLWSNSLIFALLHFIKPLPDIIRTWPQFPGLLILGLTLVFAKRSRGGRLGLSMGLHGGLVWAYYGINVGQLVQYSGQVPEWVTGVDQNPLAGIMGLLWLGLSGLVVRYAHILRR